jgi:hypothetical protein
MLANKKAALCEVRHARATGTNPSLGASDREAPMPENACNPALSTGREAVLVAAYVAALVGVSAMWMRITPPATSVVDLVAVASPRHVPKREIKAPTDLPLAANCLWSISGC